MLESLFSRLPHLSLDTSSGDMTTDQVLMLPSEGDHMIRETDQSEGSVSDEEEVANQSVHFALQQDKHPDRKHVAPPHDIICCKELLRFLISLIHYSPDQHQQPTHVTITALKLILVIIECGGHHLEYSLQLSELVGDQLCYHLFMLLSQTRSVPVFSLVVRNCCLLFHAARHLLKLQFEMFLNKLMDVVTMEQLVHIKELALECFLQLLSEPKLPSQLYVNYDCSLYCSNCFENSVKFLSKTCYPSSGTLSTCELLSVDSLLAIVNELHYHCKTATTGGSHDHSTTESHNHSSSTQPTPEDMLLLRQRKKLLVAGSSQFNGKPSKGIAFLQEQGLLSDSSTSEIANFLHENHLLDKGMIGEYIGDRKNADILEHFIKQFSFDGQPLLDSLRHFLASFRLPGESPVISRILELFSSQWLECNQYKWPELAEKFVDKDAVFIMAYSIIMLNVDLHNKQVKNPMTLKEFKKNKQGLNGNKDFDDHLLESIYQSIKENEIIMPAEHSGVVMETYKWKMLLQRQCNLAESQFSTVSLHEHDQDLFLILRGPIVTALSVLFQYAEEETAIQKSLFGFQRCAAIAAHYNLTDVFDNLIISLCKLSSLLTDEGSVSLAHMISTSNKAQQCAQMLFSLCRDHGNILREGWNNILDCIINLFGAHLLPDGLAMSEDYITGSFNLTVPTAAQSTIKSDSSFFGSIFSATAPANQKSSSTASDIVKSWNIEQLFHDTKFLQSEALLELIKAILFAARSPAAHASLGTTFDENRAIFFQELLVIVALHNRDRLGEIWNLLVDHMSSVLSAANQKYEVLTERTVVSLLRLMDRLLGRNQSDDCILSPLKLLYNEIIPSEVTPFTIINQISHGIAHMIQNNIEHIRATSDWIILFTLIEALLTRQATKENHHDNQLEIWSPSTEFSCPDDLLATNCKTISFIVRTNGAVTNGNYMSCIRCVRIVGVVSVHVSCSQSQYSIQVLDLLHSLLATSFTADTTATELQISSDNVLQLSSEWMRVCPLLQGIAHMICKSHKHTTRQSATSYLQRAILAPQLNTLLAADWHACFLQVLFPMVSCFLENDHVKQSQDHMRQETLMRVATLLCRVFLQHLVPLSDLDTFPLLWISLLDMMQQMMSLQDSELLLEAIPESLKNMMLVMTTTGVFDGCHSNLIDKTWSKLNEFVPQLQLELNPVLPSPSDDQVHAKPDQQPVEGDEASEQKATNNDASLNVVIHPPLPSLSPVPPLDNNT